MFTYSSGVWSFVSTGFSNDFRRKYGRLTSKPGLVAILHAGLLLRRLVNSALGCSAVACEFFGKQQGYVDCSSSLVVGRPRPLVIGFAIHPATQVVSKHSACRAPFYH